MSKSCPLNGKRLNFLHFKDEVAATPTNLIFSNTPLVTTELLSKVKNLSVFKNLWSKFKVMQVTVQDVQETITSPEWKEYDMSRLWQEKNIGIVVEGIVIDSYGGNHSLSFNPHYKETPCCYNESKNGEADVVETEIVGGTEMLFGEIQEYFGVIESSGREKNWIARRIIDGSIHESFHDTQNEAALASDDLLRKHGTNYDKCRLNFFINKMNEQLKNVGTKRKRRLEEEENALARKKRKVANGEKIESIYHGVQWAGNMWKVVHTIGGTTYEGESFTVEKDAAASADALYRERVVFGQRNVNKLNFPNLSEGEKKSKYSGVSWCFELRKWKASRESDGTIDILGYFDDERDAAKAADTFLKEVKVENGTDGIQFENVQDNEKFSKYSGILWDTNFQCWSLCHHVNGSVLKTKEYFSNEIHAAHMADHLLDTNDIDKSVMKRNFPGQSNKYAPGSMSEKYKGVVKLKGSNLYHAARTIDDKVFFGEGFESEEECAKAADEILRNHSNRLKCDELNFPNENEEHVCGYCNNVSATAKYTRSIKLPHLFLCPTCAQQEKNENKNNKQNAKMMPRYSAQSFSKKPPILCDVPPRMPPPAGFRLLRQSRQTTYTCKRCNTMTPIPLVSSSYNPAVKICQSCQSRENIQQGHPDKYNLSRRHCLFCYASDPRGQYYLSSQINKNICHECYVYEVACGKLLPKNERTIKPPTSKYRGVFWLDRAQCWLARIFASFGAVDCGTFVEEKEAAISTNWHCGEVGIPCYNPKLLPKPKQKS